MGLPFATTAQLDKIERAVNEKQDKLEVTSADAGKMVAVNEQGELSLVDAPAAGSKLYKHYFGLSEYTILVISNRATPYTDDQEIIIPSLNRSGIVSIILYYDDERGPLNLIEVWVEEIDNVNHFKAMLNESEIIDAGTLAYGAKEQVYEF